MSPELDEIIAKEFPCLGPPYCDSDGRVPHDNRCPASKRYRAMRVAKAVLELKANKPKVKALC